MQAMLIAKDAESARLRNLSKGNSVEALCTEKHFDAATRNTAPI